VVRLGQNFLADKNLLEAIVRDAELAPGDVVLEVGAGEGPLTERLAAAAAHVHSIEIDRGLEPTLAEVAALPNVELHWGDALKLDLAALDPPPTAVVANLPYSIATPLILRTIEQLPSVQRWTVMVQREIADRIRAEPGSRTYGVPSVLVQLACETKMLRTVDPSVFRPRPRVGSAVISLRRTGPGADAKTRSIVRAAFAHRRKTLARSLELARPGTLGRVRTLFPTVSVRLEARAEDHSPEEFADLARSIRWTASERDEPPMRTEAPAKLNLCLFLGPRRDDGLHALCSLFEPLALADALDVSVAKSDEVLCPGVEGENLAARALAALRARGWDGAPLQVEIEKRIPVAAGLGGGSADAAAVLRLARNPAYGADGVPDLAEIAIELGADVPSQLEPAFALVRGAGEIVEKLPAPAPHAVVLLPGGGGLSTAAVFAEADRLGLGRGEEELDELAGRLREAAGAGASPLAYAELLANDLEPAARSVRPDVGDALDALREAGAPLVLMSGSGPTAAGLFPTLAEAKSAAAAIGRDDAIACEAGRAP
jgi:ribosomal RNA small subunit methyltransferase A/4-diphosphocytidyl-2C-methyl-D-erythritol kinase